MVHEAMACLLNLLEQRAALEKKKRGWEILLDGRERLGCLFAQTEALVFCHGVCRPFPYRAYKRPEKLAHALYGQLLLFLDRTVRFSYLYQEPISIRKGSAKKWRCLPWIPGKSWRRCS